MHARQAAIVRCQLRYLAVRREIFVRQMSLLQHHVLQIRITKRPAFLAQLNMKEL